MLARQNGSFLVLGPDSESSAALCQAIEGLGHGVTLREDVLQGLADAIGRGVDAVILAEGLRDEDPARLCANLKMKPQTRDLGVVVQLHIDDVFQRVDAWRSGADEVLDPGLTPEELDARLQAVLRERNRVREIESDRRRLQSLVDSLVEAVLVIDAEGMVEVANRGAYRLLHLDPDILRLRSVGQILNTLGVSKETIDRVASTDAPLVEEISALVDGETRTLRVRCQRLPSNGDESASWAAVLRDVTLQREHERLKADFHSMVAHDLRSPLAVIRGYLDLLRDEGDEVLREELLEGVERKVEDVSRLLDDFLDLSQLDAGFLRLDLGPLDVAEVLEDTRSDLEVLARDKGLELVVEVDAAAELVPLQADVRRVRQAVQNLVTNAIKYGGEGALVRMGAHLTDEGLRVEISDQGPGIEESERAAVFERYTRLERGRQREKGNGLGLVIVRRIVEAHGGTVGVDSQLGVGSTFWFELPADLSGARPFVPVDAEELEI